MAKKQKQNNYAFIDSQNVNLAIRDQGWVLNFAKFRRYLKEKYNIRKAFLFIGFVHGNQTLYTSLQKHGFILVFKPTMQLPSGAVKGNVDAELVLHAMIEYPDYNKALVVSGDGDFHCLIDYLNKQGKLLKLLVPNKDKYSSLLKLPAPNRIDFMNNLRKKLEYKKREPIA